MKFLFISMLLSFAAAADESNPEEFVKSNWYTRYPAYPDYCSTPAQMQHRQIPPLTQDSPLYGDSRIVHASVIIRHGARTPWGNEMKCWEGYWTDPETAIWDCRLTQFVAPPSDVTVEHDEDENVSNNNKASDAVFLFEKKYDAFLKHPHDSHGQADKLLCNKLNGTCQVGQLLLQGYEQQITNGKYLREAYCFDGSKNSPQHSVRMRLLDTSQEPYQHPTLQYRSDDDERTVMSGQVLLRGMFEEEFLRYKKSKGSHPVIALHTGDRDRDVLSANSNICPKLNQLKHKAETSPHYKQLENSKEAKHLNHYMKKHLGQAMDKDPVDCLMTTICTDRALPEAIDDYTGKDKRRMVANDDGNSTLNDEDYEDDTYNDDQYDDTKSPTSSPKASSSSSSDDSSSDDDHEKASHFQRIYNYSVKKFIYHFLHSNAAFSKLAIAPLWREIMANILPVIHPERYNRYNLPPDAARLALFSGHDTTIVPLMATLGPKVWNETDWPPYASMMILEIHEIGLDGVKDRRYFTSDFAFRLLYNGQVMTPLVEGCQNGVALCDVAVLEHLIVPLAMKPWNCNGGWSEAMESVYQTSKELVSTPAGVLLVLSMMLTSVVIGGILCFVYLTRRIPFTNKTVFGGGNKRFSYEQGISLTRGQFDRNAIQQAQRTSLYGTTDNGSATMNEKDDNDDNHVHVNAIT